MAASPAIPTTVDSEAIEPSGVGGSVTAPATPGATDTGERAGDVSPIPTSTLLTAEGWGPLRIGMTRAEVVAAAGDDANPEAVGGPDPASCDEFRPVQAPRGMLVMIENGRLVRISLGAGSEVLTDRGVGIGDAAVQVRRTYGDEVASTPHKYVAAPAEYLTVWTIPPPAEGARGIVYEVGREGRVTRIHAGGPAIRYVEGCL